MAVMGVELTVVVARAVSNAAAALSRALGTGRRR
jgi:hypothetical protein